MVILPPGLEWWRHHPGGADWLERLPRLVAECSDRWSLGVGAPFGGSNASLALAATLPDGTAAVLKINFPDDESEREPDALAHWNGRGAVRLLEHDPSLRALLVERCHPGTQLWEIEDEEEANRIAAGVLRRIWHAPPPDHRFLLLADVAARWAKELPALWTQLRQPFERRIIDEAVAFVHELAPTQRDLVLLHQDFHGGNVLRAHREEWLAIDPKPLVGEREFDAASLIRDRRDDLARDSEAAVRVRRRLDQLAAELGLDRERMRGWAMVHALAWGFSGTGMIATGSGKVEEDMIACARWLSAC